MTTLPRSDCGNREHSVPGSTSAPTRGQLLEAAARCPAEGKACSACRSLGSRRRSSHLSASGTFLHRAGASGQWGRICWGKKPPPSGGLATLCDLAWCPAPLTPWPSTCRVLSAHPSCLCGLSRDTLPTQSLPRSSGRSPGGASPSPGHDGRCGPCFCFPSPAYVQCTLSRG